MPIIEKADDHFKDISDLKKEQDDLMARMLVLEAQGEPSESSDENSENSDSDMDSAKFMKDHKELTYGKKSKKMMSNLSN